MALIYLSLGSNIERHLHIGAALDALAENFGELKISSVYESESAWGRFHGIGTMFIPQLVRGPDEVQV